MTALNPRSFLPPRGQRFTDKHSCSESFINRKEKGKNRKYSRGQRQRPLVVHCSDEVQREKQIRGRESAGHHGGLAV